MRNISNELSSIDNILHVNHSVFLFTFRFVCKSVYLQQVRSFNLRVTREKGSCLCSSCSSSFLHGFFLRPFRVFTLEIDSGVVSLVNRTALLQMSHRNLNTLKVQRHCHVRIFTISLNMKKLFGEPFGFAVSLLILRAIGI